MIPEITLTALIALTPVERKALNEFQTRLKKDGYDISQYVNDPRFGIHRFEKGGKQTNYTKLSESWYLDSNSVEKGADFMEEYCYYLGKVQEEHDVTPKHMTALFRLETKCGEYPGEFPLIVAFPSVYIDRPDRRDEYIRYTEDFLDVFTDTTYKIVFPKDIFDVKGSWAGAYGLTQGMPDKIKKYGPRADGDGDGVCDLMKAPDAAKFAGLLLEEEFGYKKNAALALKRYNGGHKYYGPALLMYADSVEKVEEERSRIPPEKKYYSLDSLIFNIPRLPTDNLQQMKMIALVPEPIPKQPFIRRIMPHLKRGRR